MRLPSVAILNLALATGILVVGLPGITAAVRRLPSEIVIGEAESGQPVQKAELDRALQRVEDAAAVSAAAHLDVALLLLDGAEDGETLAGAAPAEGAAKEFRAYLSRVPGDARGWAGLARAELQRGRRVEASAALKASMLTGPYSPGLVLWRCAAGLDMYASLDEETRRLLEQQLRIAAENQTEALVRMVRQRHALLLTRAMLLQSPEAIAKFEAQWARP
jgi:hypothetical protein